MAPLKFWWEIDGETSSPTDNYQAFIRNLRQQLGVRYARGRPVLPVQQNPPTQFFDVIIQATYPVRFRLRMDNLYLIGYQMHNGQWLELGYDGDTHLITGSEFLGFGERYGALAGAADRPLVGTPVGLSRLEDAINNLADEADRAARARSLIVAIIMICESTRFIPISEHIAQHNNFPVATWMENLFTSWGELSGAVLDADARGGVRIRVPNNIQIPNEVPISSVAQIARILGILLGVCLTSRGPTRFPRMAIDEGQCLSGLPLVQVFSVRIDNIDDEDPGDLYGTITIINGLYTQYIYNRTSDNPESIKPGQYAKLTGPSETLTAFGNVTIKLLLTDHDTWSPDDEIINKEISWDAYNISSVYDKLIGEALHSSRGSVTVNYAVLRNAVAARVTVTVEEAGETISEVYGQVSAHYDNWENPETTFLLFDRASDNYAEVRRWQTIPLLRSAIAVPLTNSLKVIASLYDHDPISADDLIAKGSVEFPVPEKIPDTSFKGIQGEDGNWVQVTVYWSYGF